MEGATMRLKDLPLIGLLVLVLPLAACAPAAVEAAANEPVVQVDPVEGTGLGKVTLSAKAAERLGIQTAAVAVERSGGSVVPYPAVLYDETGKTWVFTNPDGLAYVRAEIVVKYIEGDLAHLTSGPPPGTAVVTVGVAELLGAENGVGDPE
jgi:hypothetical protein